MTLTFFELFAVYINKLGQPFFILTRQNLFKQRYISSVKRYKYLSSLV